MFFSLYLNHTSQVFLKLFEVFILPQRNNIMKTARRLFFLGFLIFSQTLAYRSFSQELNINALLTDPWVDSVFESMTITERINQLLILGIDKNRLDETDLPATFGGFYLYQQQWLLLSCCPSLHQHHRVLLNGLGDFLNR